MSEHDQQLQIVREDHAQEVSHLQHLAAAAQGNIIVQLDKARKAPVSTLDSCVGCIIKFVVD